MTTSDFYGTTKYCPCCAKNVRYLASIELSFCVECGGEVRLFSAEEWASFNAALEARKPKGGRPASQRPTATGRAA
jgi:hypothetical protein